LPDRSNLHPLLQEEPSISADRLTPAQRLLLDSPLVPEASDLVDHVPFITDR
jgi:hypothetical protein